MEESYPSFDICNLKTNRLSNDLFNIDRFYGYVESNPHIRSVHKHSFFHLAYFTEGTGTHILDFETFPIKKGVIYFMRPNQVHKWSFDGKVDGYVMNFSDTFFDQLLISSQITDQFSFFSLFSQQQVFELNDLTQHKTAALFEKILTASAADSTYTTLEIATLMLQLFILVARETGEIQLQHRNNNAVLMRKFIELIEGNFNKLRLPKEYAALLFVTSNHLNTVCREQMKMAAGEMIRDRVILEAKRLLVNFDLSIATIASELNFEDNSYFVKFFKKYTGYTPEAFRKLYYKGEEKSG